MTVTTVLTGTVPRALLRQTGHDSVGNAFEHERMLTLKRCKEKSEKLEFVTLGELQYRIVSMFLVTNTEGNKLK